ncbi:NAD dependent epimerase/dehydratase family protein [Prevotella sp. oral taxon 472 str. F0295]|nr:SDR family oxidoreductase [Prevotella sp. oral taxon 472]EEX52706.1 NAD dependent epimerase/dehydratase family protein [Prevotella sp. oral taxon 472 str. F0295]
MMIMQTDNEQSQAAERTRVLLAGATGYLGRFVLNELQRRNYSTRVIVRTPSRLGTITPNVDVRVGEVTQADTLKGVCEDIDVVISTVGITRQKDGMTYMDVDFQANANLIDEAKRSGVKRFIYVSVFNGEQMRHLKICEAKERLGDYLKNSGLDYCIVRPTGFFSDMGDFLKMAKGGSVWLFGNGMLRMNPIHGADLARAVVDVMDSHQHELNIGGPDVLTHNQIAELALRAYGKQPRVRHLPDFVRRSTLFLLRKLTSAKTYGPLEFFLTAMAMDMQAPTYGEERLEDFFKKEVEVERK